MARDGWISTRKCAALPSNLLCSPALHRDDGAEEANATTARREPDAALPTVSLTVEEAHKVLRITQMEALYIFFSDIHFVEDEPG
jgi:hypothetical protein